MAINQPFTTASQALANYSYTDIDEGLGYVDYYGFISETSAGLDYGLTKNTTFTAALKSSGAIDIDTSTFNTAKRVRGNAIVQLSYGGTNMAAADNVIATVTIYKYDGSTETAISSTITTPTKSGAGAGINVDRSTTLIIPLTATSFKKGDLLRIKIGSTGNNSLLLYMSPNDLGTPYSDALHTKFIASIPFELNI